MNGRREWLRQAIGQALGLWGASQAVGLAEPALGQTTPAKKGNSADRYTVRKPELARSKDASKKSADAGSPPIRADERLGKLLDATCDAQHLPGMIGAIVRGGSLASIGAAGVRKIGSAEPMQVLDQVHLGSNTKAMTATLLGMLVDDGLLNWSSTIRDVFPEVASRLHPDFQTSRLRTFSRTAQGCLTTPRGGACPA